jgi:large subunit ribosomal protein L37e
MSKGTPSKGKHANRKTHVPCRRCGTNAFNIRKGICASCGYGKTTTIRTYNWAKTH